MKVKVLTRSRANTERECIGDVRKQFRNLDPKYHPMQRAREYQRAIMGAKLDRMFAAPLFGRNMEHADAVTCSALCHQHLLPLASGCVDGTIKLWDLSTRKEMMVGAGGHSRAITGLTFETNTSTNPLLYSCSDDGCIRAWSMNQQQQNDDDEVEEVKRSALSSSSSSKMSKNSRSMATWKTDAGLKSIDHNWSESQFGTASSDGVCLWSPNRMSPLQTYTRLWESDDTVHFLSFNPAEANLMGVCTMDNGVGLIDARIGTALRKTVLKMRSNVLRFNPMEPLNFIVANEDHQVYLFDLRNLTRPVRIYKGHVNAVMDVRWSPTGKEFVTAGYDNTVRIFTRDHGGRARDIYHTRRMQRVMTVQYTHDNQYVISGSDDGNLRVWKAQASQSAGQRTTREERALRYRQTLIEKHHHLPEIRRIHSDRKVPKRITKQQQQALQKEEKEQKKQSNRIAHSKPGTHSFVSEKSKIVVRKVE